MPAKPASLAAAQRPRRGKKYFTLAEAQRAVPYVARIVRDVTAAYRQALEIRTRLEQSPAQADQDQLRTQYETVMDQLNLLVEELLQVGVELKDFEKGLVDFPALHEEREICLCWHQEESSITHWHEVDAGFAGRQSVALLQSPA